MARHPRELAGLRLGEGNLIAVEMISSERQNIRLLLHRVNGEVVCKSRRM
jgi:hypothetical protein